MTMDAPRYEAEQKIMSERNLAVMVDIETLGVGDDAVIMEIGAVMFWRTPGGACELGDSFFLPVKMSKGQGDRVIDAGTLCWWTGDATRAEYFLEHVAREDDEMILADALDRFFRWVLDLGCEHSVGRDEVEVWAKGDFDLRILKHAAKSHGLEVPWKYHQARELRTVLKWAGVAGNSADTVHRALDDAKRQVKLLEMAEGVLAKGL